MKHIRRLHSHIKKHHKYYILGILSSILAIKVYALMFAGISVVQYGVHHKIFADTINSGELYTGDNLTGDLFTGEIDYNTGDNLTGDLFTGEIDYNTGDNLTGDLFTGEIDYNTGDNLTGDLFTGEIDYNTGDNLTGDLFTGEIDYNTGDNLTGDLFIGEIDYNTGISRDFKIDNIKFDDILEAELSVGYYSSPVMITGINTGVIITPHNLLYIVNTGLLTSDTSIVYQGDLIQVYMVSMNTYEAVQEGYIEIGTGQYSFYIGTKEEPVIEIEEIVEDKIEENTGSIDTGNYLIFSTSTGDTNTGDTNTGDTNTGDTNTGDTNTGFVYTGDIKKISVGSGLLDMFKYELYKYQVCKQQINIKEVDIKVDGDNYELLLPKFESKFLGNISALFSNLIIQKLNNQWLAEEEINEVINNFNNFLVVLKLLRDGNITNCHHSLSNYYINKFQNSLIEYGIFGGKKSVN